MNCPICDNVRMREVMKEDVTIDVCPSCKGVWLDRGELDKLMQGVNAMRQEWDERELGGMPGGAGMPAGAAPGQPSQSSPQQPYPPAQPAPGYGQQPPAGYGAPQQPVYCSHPQGQGYYGGMPPQGGYGYDKYGSKYGYDKYGRPYKKKKKTVLDVFGDLFD